MHSMNIQLPSFRRLRCFLSTKSLSSPMTVFTINDNMFRIKELFFLVFLSFLFGPVLSRDIEYCYASDEQPYLKFATKTAYHFVHGSKIPKIPDCDPVQIWMLAKYGTRYPEKDKILQMGALSKLREQIIYNHETRGYGHLCDADLEKLRSWNLHEFLSQPGIAAEELTEQGIEDLNLLAKRTKTNFPELFPSDAEGIHSGNYVFRSATGNRIIGSLTSFTSGLFNNAKFPIDRDPTNNTLFVANRSCPKWESEVKNNSDAFKEVTSFGEGSEYRNLIQDVSLRLGFLYNLTEASINIMYDMCRYDKAWKVTEISPWCAVFNKEELQVLEYKEDLKAYYNSGYGHKMNPRLGCPLLQDMVRHFKKLEGQDCSNEPKGIFNLAASSRDLELFLAALEIAKDPRPLLASNYPSMTKRQWKTSEITPFAGNIAAVFYKCRNSLSPNKVMFYLAENSVQYENCEVGLCDWDYLKKKFDQVIAADCNWNFCNQSGAIPSLGKTVGLIWIILPVLVFLNSR